MYQVRNSIRGYKKVRCGKIDINLLVNNIYGFNQIYSILILYVYKRYIFMNYNLVMQKFKNIWLMVVYFVCNELKNFFCEIIFEQKRKLIIYKKI